MIVCELVVSLRQTGPGPVPGWGLPLTAPPALTIGILVAGACAWWVSGLWAARIAGRRGRRPGPHWLGGLLLPVAYPLLLVAFLRKESEDPPASRYTGPSIQPPHRPAARIPFPVGGRRPIGRAPEPAAPGTQEHPEDPAGQLAPYRAYFQQYLGHDLTASGRLLLEYGDDVVIADRIVEILPTAVVAETRRNDEPAPKCVRIPFTKIGHCRQLRPHRTKRAFWRRRR